VKSFLEQSSTNLWEKLQWKALLDSDVWAASKKHYGNAKINESDGDGE